LLACDEFGEEFCHGLGELLGGVDDVEMVAGEHHREGLGGGFFDGEGVGGNAVELAGLDGFADVFDAVGALVAVVVARASIGDEDDDFSAGGLVDEEFLGVAQGGADAGVALWFESAEVEFGLIPWFIEVLEGFKAAGAAGVRGKSCDGEGFDVVLDDFADTVNGFHDGIQHADVGEPGIGGVAEI